MSRTDSLCPKTGEAPLDKALAREAGTHQTKAGHGSCRWHNGIQEAALRHEAISSRDEEGPILGGAAIAAAQPPAGGFRKRA